MPAHGKFKFAFWNFLEFFSLNIFNLQLVESVDMELTDIESRLYREERALQQGTSKTGVGVGQERAGSNWCFANYENGEVEDSGGLAGKPSS